MRKIFVENYNIRVQTAEGKPSVAYDVKGSLITCLLHPILKLGARELLVRNKIGMKIEEADKFVLLEETEYEKLKSAVDTIEGFTQNDVELINRVFDAEQIDVKEK